MLGMPCEAVRARNDPAMRRKVDRAGVFRTAQGGRERAVREATATDAVYVEKVRCHVVGHG